MTPSDPPPVPPPPRRLLRDHLAYDRTSMANERSLLAYVRTALTMLVTGLGFLKFFEAPASQVVGWAMLALAPLVFAWGVYRFLVVRRHYRVEMEQLPE
jgi:putative membrane protein